MLRRIPNFRFIISWTSAERLDGNVSGAGRVEVRPCIPYDYSKFIVTRPVPAHRFEEMNEFAVLLSLPFTTKLQMLWDEFGGAMPKKGAPQGLGDVVEVEMITELARLVHPNPPWPDCIEKAEIISHLPRVLEFLNYSGGRQFSADSLNRVVEIIGDLRLLAACCPGTSPRPLTIVTRRKNLWSELLPKLDQFIKFHFEHLGLKTARAPYIKYLTHETARSVSETPATRKDKILQRVLSKVPINVGMDFSDPSVGVVDFEMMGNIVLNQKEAADWKQIDWSSATQLKEDLAHAKAEIGDDMTRLPGYYA